MKIFKKPTRVWINQPSKLHPHYRLHGRAAIAWTEPSGHTNVYFIHGNLQSISIDPSCLETKNSQANVFQLNRTNK